MTKPFALIAPFALLALAACEDGAETSSDGSREASGEVLEGSISDAMLPLDEVRSQAPRAEPEPDEGTAGSDPASAEADPAAAPAEEAEAQAEDSEDSAPEAADEPAE